MLGIFRKRERPRWFKDAVAEEAAFYTDLHGDLAIEKLEEAATRPEIRTRYREVLQTAANTLRESAAKASRAKK